VVPPADADPEAAPEADAEAEVQADEEVEVSRRRRRRGRRAPRRDPMGMARFVTYMMPAWCAMLATVESPHLEAQERDFLQQVAGPEPGKTVVPPGEIRNAVGPDLDAWILAAQVEHDAFLGQDAVQEATAEERREYGKKPLPMLNVW